MNDVPVQITVEKKDVEPVTVLEQDQVTVVVENLVEEPVEEETTTEVEEQVMIPNVINAENISNSVTVPVEVICEGVVTAQDETFVETNLDESQHENATDVPTATQSHEMDTNENLPNTLEDTNENLFDNLIDTQVIAHLQDFESDDEEASLKSTKRRKIIMFESSDSMNECQEDISTRIIANAMEVMGDI
nr:hypothetical protein Iba_chr03cCG7580 [Ipomoea batatas]